MLLTVGYSACHWCHVMAHESFENHRTAALMNELFVSIKVDREERPDVDNIYMQAVQAMTGRGGWPMTVFCCRMKASRSTAAPTSRRKTRQGMPGFSRRPARRSIDAYRKRRQDVEKLPDTSCWTHRLQPSHAQATESGV